VFHVKLELIGREGSSVRCLDREGVCVLYLNVQGGVL